MTIKIKPVAQNIRLLSILVFTVFGLISSHLMAETNPENRLSDRATFLSISPERCVALREGQVCYQNIVLKWQTQHKGNFCLYFEDAKISQHCWSQSNQGVYEMDFQSSESRRFVLRAKESTTEIAGVDMIVAWVYGNKKRRRASWRLF